MFFNKISSLNNDISTLKNFEIKDLSNFKIGDPIPIIAFFDVDFLSQYNKPIKKILGGEYNFDKQEIIFYETMLHKTRTNYPETKLSSLKIVFSLDGIEKNIFNINEVISLEETHLPLIYTKKNLFEWEYYVQNRILINCAEIEKKLLNRDLHNTVNLNRGNKLKI